MSNPVLQERILNSSSFNSLENDSSMTINGTIIKTCLLSILLILTFAYTWYLQLAGFADKVAILRTVGTFGGFGLALFICFGPKNKFLAVTTSLYAMCEGLFLGSYSALLNQLFPGIVVQAAMGTIFALFSMLFLYQSKIVRCTDKFRRVISSAVFAIFITYLLQFVLSFFHFPTFVIFSNSIVGIVFSGVVVIVASFSLITDFDMIENLSGRVDKWFEWYGGFALLVTIVWLYIEILQLLAKLQSRNN